MLRLMRTLIGQPTRSVILFSLSVRCLCLCLVLAGEKPAGAATSAPTDRAAQDDPYLWLEKVTDERALTWVREQNAMSTNELESAQVFEPLRTRLLSIMDSKERIPYVAKHGHWYYNFWRDQANPRGLWR